VEVLRHWIAPNILGLDPFDLEAIWERMDFYAPTYPMAKAAIDIALWDIKAKALKLPLYRLLGSSRTERIPLTALIGLAQPGEMASEALRRVEKGYRGLRLKIAAGRDFECVRAVREAVGEEISIRVDCNQGYSTHQAIRMIKVLEPFDVELVEQPTVWWDFKALATVAKAVDIPIMPHESLYYLSDVKALLDLGAIGVLGLKTYRPGGGLTNARRLLETARILNLPCLLHDDVELGVSLAAAAHLITAYRRVITHRCELSGYPQWIVDDVVETPIKIEGGYAEVPKGRGLGVELAEEKLKRYAKKVIIIEKR
jgi:muconate cycloisomerase